MFCTGAAPTVPGISARFSSPGPALRQRPGDEVVPVLAGAGLDDPGVGALLDQAQAAQLDLEHQRRHVAREHDVAAAAEDELRRAAEFRVVDHAAHVGIAVDAHQRVRQRRQAEAVEGRRLTPSRRAWRNFAPIRTRIWTASSATDTSTITMPSFDTVLEPNLVECATPSSRAAKEIGTRFDFKGSSAPDRAARSKEIMLYADSDFQIGQVQRHPARQAGQARRRHALPRPQRQGREDRRRQGQAAAAS